MMKTNERRYIRVKCFAPATLRIRDKERECEIRDISLCGAFVKTPVEVRLDQKVKLRTTLSGEDQPHIHLSGRIVRIVPDHDGPQDQPPGPGSGFGLDFGAISLRSREAIDAYVRRTFRAFRRLQFELARTDPDPEVLRRMVAETHLAGHTYTPESLKTLVARELESFRFRGKDGSRAELS